LQKLSAKLTNEHAVLVNMSTDVGAGVVVAGLTTGAVVTGWVGVGAGTVETAGAGLGDVVAADPGGEFTKSPTEVQKPA